jgi:hypothetical protein
VPIVLVRRLNDFKRHLAALPCASEPTRRLQGIVALLIVIAMASVLVQRYVRLNAPRLNAPRQDLGYFIGLSELQPSAQVCVTAARRLRACSGGSRRPCRRRPTLGYHAAWAHAFSNGGSIHIHIQSLVQ